jgi:hypothetical protein
MTKILPKRPPPHRSSNDGKLVPEGEKSAIEAVLMEAYHHGRRGGPTDVKVPFGKSSSIAQHAKSIGRRAGSTEPGNTPK